MHHIIYLSQATVAFTEAALQDLLLVSRQRNAQFGISGLLLYGNGQFVQVLEGEEVAVREVYRAIQQDPRHRSVIAYADKAIAQRAFAGWAMAFHALSSPQLAEIAGYLAPANWDVKRTGLRWTDVQLLELLRSFIWPAEPGGG